MSEVFVITAVRSPLGGGALLKAQPDEPPFVETELSAAVLQAAMQRLGVDRSRLESVLWSDHAGLSLHNALIHSGMPALSPGVLVDSGSLSSQQAIHFSAQAILAGDLELVLAGGVTAFPVEETGLCADPILRPLAERWAQEWSLDRAELDDLVCRAGEAQTPAGSLVKAGELLAADEPGRQVTQSDLDSQHPLSPQSALVPDHFPQYAYAAAALGLASVQAVGRYNLSPRASLAARSLVALGRDQAWAGIIPATRHALRRAELGLEEIDLFQVSANFYGVEAVWAQEFGVAAEKRLPMRFFTGPSSGALGLVDLLDQLEARSLKYGMLASAGHQGLGCVTIIERL